MDAPMDPCLGRSSSSLMPAPADRGQRLADVADAVSDVVDPLAAAGEELAHRSVRRQRLEQLHVAGRDPAAAAAPGPTASMASRTPCSSLTSRLTTSSPNVAR